MKFGFVAKHRGALPVYLMCEALGVSWGGFYAWLTRPRGRRSLSSGAGPVLAAHYGLVYAGKHDLAARGGRADDGRVASGKPVALLHHLDQGSQYTREHFQRLLDEQGITCSMSRAGEVWDNSAMESFFSSLKTERIARKVS